ncbi:hypothetical protein ALT761_00942 [Alteromonas sp. 76-1]|uniref:hypothetical protein n=1 Tax=Alteromonas sp. 76-1 TaxID=2358187 RepID=UPI000FD16A36|nr:hypothetical protein [Alteromonas sp. 76-1]VEL95983.1 hypothetical protein ALT761_00942 [Alteromonas sp. 76-1]
MPSSRFWDKSKTIQERWFRYKLHKKYGKMLQKLLLCKLHRKLIKNHRITDEAIGSAINAIVTQLKKLDEDLFPATKEFFNICLFFLLAERDIQALKPDAFAHPNEAKRNIALRALLLTIYEWDMGKVTGKNMKIIYGITGISEQAKTNLINSLKEVRKSRKNITTQFSELRHNTIAHRESDALQQYEIISNLNVIKFKSEIEDFYIATDKLFKAMTDALLEIGALPNLFYQVINGNKRT